MIRTTTLGGRATTTASVAASIAAVANRCQGRNDEVGGKLVEVPRAGSGLPVIGGDYSYSVEVAQLIVEARLQLFVEATGPGG